MGEFASLFHEQQKFLKGKYQKWRRGKGDTDGYQDKKGDREAPSEV